jgi:hypothetical protein
VKASSARRLADRRCWRCAICPTPPRLVLESASAKLDESANGAELPMAPRATFGRSCPDAFGYVHDALPHVSGKLARANGVGDIFTAVIRFGAARDRPADRYRKSGRAGRLPATRTDAPKPIWLARLSEPLRLRARETLLRAGRSPLGQPYPLPASHGPSTSRV